MSTMTSQITSLTIVCSTVYADADQRKLQSSASPAFVWVTHRWPVNSPQKGPVTQKMFSYDDVIMWCFESSCLSASDVTLMEANCEARNQLRSCNKQQNRWVMGRYFGYTQSLFWTSDLRCLLLSNSYIEWNEGVQVLGLSICSEQLFVLAFALIYYELRNLQ